MEYSDREWKLMQEVERLKKKVQKQNIEISDLKVQKKTFESKLKIVIDYAEDLKKRLKENSNLKLENDLLKAKVKELENQIEKNTTVIQNLKVRINKDSFNSSKPSSTDNIYHKEKHINNGRKKGGKTGGQYGHVGVTLDEEYIKGLIREKKVKHVVIECGNKNNKNYKSKYVCDTEITAVVYEYRYYEEEDGSYSIPKEMMPIVQYGSNAKALMIYLTNELMCPLNKTALFMQSISNHYFKYSEGTIVNTQRNLDKRLQPLVEEIKKGLIQSKVLHVDETGVRVNGVLKWLHTYCTKDLVYYGANDKRGGDAIDDFGILQYFVNVLVHDHWKSYYTKGTHMTHAECNAHILRYLKGVFEIVKLNCVENLISLFVKMNEDKKKAIYEGKACFTEEEIKSYEKEYDRLLSLWGTDLNNRLRKAKDPKIFDDERTLHDRIVEYKENHLLFIKDFDVPFDNNSAERALRMIKTKLKVSGGFRTDKGTERFANARSFMMTSKIREENILSNLVSLFRGEHYSI